MKKKPLFILLLILFVLTLILVGCDFSNDDDSKEDNAEEIVETHITTVVELLAIKNGGHYVLDNDIDCQNKKWTSVDLGGNITLSIDGNGHFIKNVIYISESNCFGLIGSVDKESEVSIKNLAIENFKIDLSNINSYSKIFIGAFIGHSYSNVKIYNCYVRSIIDVPIQRKDNYVGVFAGYLGGGSFTNCLSDADIRLHFDYMDFSKASVYAGGFAGGVYSCSFSELVNLTSIKVDTSLSISWGTVTYVGGLCGDALSALVSYCLSAPKYLHANTFIDDEVKIGNVISIGTGKIGGLFGNLENKRSDKHNYYCTYFDENLSKEEQTLECSYYDKLNGSTCGVAVNLNKTAMLSENFMFGDYSFIDKDELEMETYLHLNGDSWNAGVMRDSGFMAPSLKVFD